MTLPSLAPVYRLVFLFWILASTAQAATPDTLKARITVTEATVFQEGASLQSKVQVKLPPGNSILRIRGLPRYLQPETIRIFPGPGLQSGAPRMPDQRTIDTAASPEWQNLQQRLQQLQGEKSGLRSQKKGIEAQKAILEANRKLEGSAVNAEELRAMLQLQGQEAARLSQEEIALNQNLKKLEARLRKLQQEKSRLLQTIAQRSGEVLIPVQVPQNGSYHLKLHYAYPSAHWRSSYKVEAQTPETLHIHHKALVYQNSGLDWNDIKLTLALGSSRGSQPKQELNPQYIDFPPPSDRRYSRSTSVQDQELQNGQEAVAVKLQEVEEPSSTQQQNLSYRSFTLNKPVSVKHDQSSTAFSLKQLSRPSQFHYQATPKLQPGSFLLAQLSLPDSLSMPPGEMELYQEGTYVGRYHWDALMARDTHYLPLGEDAEVPVERKLVRRYTETKAFSSKQTTHYHYRLSATNRRRDTVNLKLYDQVPLSRHESISVRHELPADAQYDPESGEVKFPLIIPPGARRQRSIRFSITYPEDRVPRLPQ